MSGVVSRPLLVGRYEQQVRFYDVPLREEHIQRRQKHAPCSGMLPEP